MAIRIANKTGLNDGALMIFDRARKLRRVNIDTVTAALVAATKSNSIKDKLSICIYAIRHNQINKGILDIAGQTIYELAQKDLAAKIFKSKYINVFDNAMILASELNQYENALKIFEQARKLNRVNSSIVRRAMVAAVKSKKPEYLLKIAEQAKKINIKTENNVPADTFIFNEAMRLSNESNMHDNTLKIFELAKKQNCLNDEMFNTAIIAASKSGKDKYVLEISEFAINRLGMLRKEAFNAFVASANKLQSISALTRFNEECRISALCIRQRSQEYSGLAHSALNDAMAEGAKSKNYRFVLDTLVLAMKKDRQLNAAAANAIMVSIVGLETMKPFEETKKFGKFNDSFINDVIVKSAESGKYKYVLKLFDFAKKNKIKMNEQAVVAIATSAGRLNRKKELSEASSRLEAIIRFNHETGLTTKEYEKPTKYLPDEITGDQTTYIGRIEQYEVQLKRRNAIMNSEARCDASRARGYLSPRTNIGKVKNEQVDEPQKEKHVDSVMAKRSTSEDHKRFD